MSTKDDKILISIGIPIYNEESNVQKLFNSLIQQKIDIEKTIIVNDGSTDNTLMSINKIDKDIKKKLNTEIINLEINKGKANALNLIFRRSESEYLILIDSDIQFIDKYTFVKLLEPFKDVNIKLVCGWYTISSRDSFDIIGRADRFSAGIIEDIGKSLNGIYGATGAIMAISKDIYKNLNIPIDIIRDDAYIYMYVMSKNMKYMFNPKAKVRLLSHHDTYKKFLLRQARNKSIPEKYIFGDLVQKGYKDPPLIFLVKIFIKKFRYNIGDGLCWSILQITSIIHRKLRNSNITPKWRD